MKQPLPETERVRLRYILSIPGYQSLEKEVLRLQGRYAGVSSQIHYLLGAKHPVVLLDPEQEPRLWKLLTPTGIRSVRACGWCNELMLSSSSQQTGPQDCSLCQRVETRNRKRRWREEVGLHTTPEPRQCVVCSTSFTPKRADAKTCSGKCRTKLSRQTTSPTTP